MSGGIYYSEKEVELTVLAGRVAEAMHSLERAKRALRAAKKTSRGAHAPYWLGAADAAHSEVDAGKRRLAKLRKEYDAVSRGH